MQKLPIFISFIIALILTIYIYIFEFKSEKEILEFSKYILSFDPVKVKEIEIKNKEAPAIIINRDSKVWKISKPLTCRANQELIESIVNQLPKLPKILNIAKKEQKPLVEYGLDNPILTVTITYQNSNKGKDATCSLLFGKLSGSKNEVFAKTNIDDSLYLLPASVFNVLSKDFVSFRDRKVIDLSPEKLVKISYDRPEEKWTIEKINLFWLITEPYSWYANQENTLNLINNLSKLEVSRFVENDLSKKDFYGLSQPATKIHFIDSDKNATTIYIGAIRAGSIFIQNTKENFIFSVDAQEMIKCLPYIQTLKDFSLFVTKSPEIVQLDYNQNKEIFNFQKNIKQLWMVNNSNYPLEQQAVTSFVEHVVLTSPEYFVDGDIKNEEFGFNSPQAITVNIINLKSQKETLKIGALAKGWVIPTHLQHFNSLEKAKNYAQKNQLKEIEIQELSEQYYAKFNDFTQIFTIDEAIVKILKGPLVKFEPLEFPEIDLDRIYTIERIIDGKKEHFQRFGSNINWEITSPEKANLNSKEISLFIFTLCFFKVEEWVKDKFTVEEFKNYGLDFPYIQIEATFNNLSNEFKTGQYKYLVSKKINGKYFGCIYISVNKSEYKLVPKLFIVPEKIVTERFLKKLH